MKYLIQVYIGEQTMDDVDHLGNRRVRSVGELIGIELKKAFVKMVRIAKDRMALKETDTLKPQDLISQLKKGKKLIIIPAYNMENPIEQQEKESRMGRNRAIRLFSVYKDGNLRYNQKEYTLEVLPWNEKRSSSKVKTSGTMPFWWVCAVRCCGRTMPMRKVLPSWRHWWRLPEAYPAA